MIKDTAIHSCTLPASALAPGEARSWASDILKMWGILPKSDLVQALILLVSELVTNAVKAPVSVAVDLHLLTIRIYQCDVDPFMFCFAVGDRSDVEPLYMGCPDADAESGRGGYLLEALTFEYGGWLCRFELKMVWRPAGGKYLVLQGPVRIHAAMAA